MSGSPDRTARIETYTGHPFDVFDPAPRDVRLEDIAAGLAHTCRFGGHCTQFYSVAHHSIHVSRELPADAPRLQLLGLFHDAGEAYVGDVPRPIKAEFEAFERVEDRILRAVWTAFDLEAPTESEWDRVMAADDRLLAYEADLLLADASWAPDPPDRAYDLRADSIDDVREQFRDRAHTLLAELEA
ncbi:HD domain-containing protein [Salinadaptatus halalkaliphilus]|uniref:HD domain-containing protein n=1 Tax=Salinadaptatus halalkaliphilus TaxID=2419781 RepID=A0A4S3TKT8_9EURY|nr:HD domain-containing protein [Salinadaptatus halalkaliphilus]THE64772.1 HD domain-containing protein [Salinadaptatus halalkaliphilus]